MRGGIFSPLLWLAIMAGGIGAALYGGTLDGRDPMAPRLFFAGLTVALAALLMLVVAWRKTRRGRRDDLAASPDAVARWQVYPTDMAAFRALDAARAGRLWSLANTLKFPDPPPEGLAIVVGRDSLIVGGKLYDLGIRHFGIPGEVAWHEGHPGYIEISLFLAGDKKRTHIVVLRLPVPAAARTAAAAAFAHLAGQVKPEDRAHIHRCFANHFEAAGQETDAPHRMQRRRKIVLPLIALFCLILLGIIFLRPRTEVNLYENYPPPANPR
ncbi:MAG: hypothetical protein QOH47_173 [Sphingomonadales bacterium]|nr:hypothetical protein [Sphingomonadales bacterium]